MATAHVLDGDELTWFDLFGVRKILREDNLSIHGSVHQDERDQNLFPSREFQAPKDRQRENKDEEIGGDIHGSVG